MAKPRYAEHQYMQLQPTIELCGRCGRSIVHYAQGSPQCWCGEDEKGVTYIRAELVEEWIRLIEGIPDFDMVKNFQDWIKMQPPVHLIQWLQDRGLPCPIK